MRRTLRNPQSASHQVFQKSTPFTTQAPTLNMSKSFSLRLSLIAQATLLAAMAGNAQAQTPEKLERVEITGSSIKRLDGETALPVQVLKREDIAKTGASTAAELMKSISANTAALTDGMSISDSSSGQRGFNGANLRGVGVSSTLILLNGRRMANFATPGDDAGVDLNNIPSGAIDRVEILKDGASALYGTDAIGGVINFITRKDYRGIDAYAYHFGTQEGGAEKTTVTLTGGLGDVSVDGFNIFAVLDAQKLGSMRSSERDFLQDRRLKDTLPFYLSTRPLPGNIRLSGTRATRNTQLAALTAAGINWDGVPFTERTINLFGKNGCQGPASVYAPENLPEACSYDYMLDTELYPKSDRLSFMTRGVVALGSSWEAFGELLLANSKSTYVASPNPVEVRRVPTSALNKFLPAGKQLPFGGDVDVRFRVSDAGNRSNEVSSDASRVVAGLKGVLAGWDVESAVVRAENKVNDRIVSGYFLFDEFNAAVRAGSINPFAANTGAGLDTINQLKVADDTRKSTGTTTSIDAKASRELMQLEGGPLQIALGGEFRKEEQQFTPSALIIGNNVTGDRSERGDIPVASKRDRKVAGIYTELNAPVTKALELQGAVRFDKYQGVGNTVNPKAGIRWQPAKDLVVRASMGTGFRAPSFTDLYAPRGAGSSPALLTDPGCLASDPENTPADCTQQWRVERQSNPNLKPEKSVQQSLGIVFEPSRNFTASLDYWRIINKDIISTLGEQVILGDLAKYDLPNTQDADGNCIPAPGDFVCRVDGEIDSILLRKENQGELRTSGLDLEAKYRMDAGLAGRFTASISGTYVLEYKRQFGGSDAFVSNVGRFLQDQVVQRWRHRAAIDWDMGAFGLTLANNYSSSYDDHNTAFDLSGNPLPKNRVKAYSIWDLTGSWQVSKELRLRGGIQNLADTAPPFSNQGYFFLSTYDPSYTDPRGRAYYLSVSYSLK
jgi:iron complex outermembrane recepter protein